MNLITVQKHVPPNVDALIVAMFLMFARAPRKAEPDADGFYDLAEIGADPGKNLGTADAILSGKGEGPRRN